MAALSFDGWLRNQKCVICLDHMQMLRYVIFPSCNLKHVVHRDCFLQNTNRESCSGCREQVTHYIPLLYRCIPEPDLTNVRIDLPPDWKDPGKEWSVFGTHSGCCENPPVDGNELGVIELLPCNHVTHLRCYLQLKLADSSNDRNAEPINCPICNER